MENKPYVIRDRALDGIRGIAILLVMISHAVMTFPLSGMRGFQRDVFGVLGEGFVGVDLFFVLSGFLITRILLRTREDPHYFRNFYARRVLRIFPLYYLFIVFASLAFKDMSGQEPWFWFYASNFRVYFANGWISHWVDHTWSLAIEEQFYLFWPWIVASLPVRVIPGIVGAILVACPLLRAFLFAHGHVDAGIRVFTPAHLDGLMIGAAVASLSFARPVWFQANWKKIALSLIGLGSMGRLFGHHLLHLSWAALRAVTGTSWWSLIFAGAVMFAAFSPEDSRARRLLSVRPLVSLGVYSYALYLIHQPLFMLILQEMPANAPVLSASTTIVLGGGLALVLAYLSFRYFEGPFLALKKAFEASGSRDPATPSPAASADRARP